MLDINKDMATVLKVALKGSPEALAHAYRRSIRAIAEFDLSFGPDSQPSDLEFRWEWIDGYRVLTIVTDGAGISVDFNNIAGITEYAYAHYDAASCMAVSNDTAGTLLNHRDRFGLPQDVEFELD